MSKPFKLYDLTHNLDNLCPTWSTNCGFYKKPIVTYKEACQVDWIEMNAGAGTHIDAPLHFIPGARSISEIPVEELLAPVFVIDVTHKIHADYYISYDDIKNFENNYSKITPGSVVLAYTNWDKYWGKSEYRNLDSQGQMHFPGFSKEAAECLIERQVAGIGIDSLSPDCLDLTFPVHHLILGQNKFIIENLTNLNLVSPINDFILTLPIKIKDGTEAPARVVSLSFS